MKIVAFLDSCVLYPFTVRDLLIQFSYEGMFRAKWSSQGRREVVKNVEHDNPSAKGKMMLISSRLLLMDLIKLFLDSKILQDPSKNTVMS